MTRIIGWGDDFQTLNIPQLWEDYNPQDAGDISVSEGILIISVPRDTVERFRGLFSIRGLTHPEFEVAAKLRWSVPTGGEARLVFSKGFGLENMYYIYYYGGSRYYMSRVVGGAVRVLASYDLRNDSPPDFEYWRFRYRRGLMVWDRSTVSEYGPWTRFARVTDRSLAPPFRLALVSNIRATSPAGSVSYMYVDWVKVNQKLTKVV